MKRLLFIILSLTLLLALLAGCAATSATRSNNTTQAATNATTAADQWGGEKTPDTNPSEAFTRKQIRNATLDLEVKDVAAAYNLLLSYASQYGGYEVARMQSKSNGYITIDAQIKIEPGQLDAFLVYAATLGDVINTQTTSSDITDDYYDAQTRLKTLEMTLEKYYGFLEKATSIDESLKVQNQIDSLTLQIESFKGQLKLWDSLLAESVITLRLRQSEDPVVLKKEINWSTLSFNDMLYLMKSGVTRVANFLVSALQWLAIALVVTSPLWIIGLVVLFVVRRRNKRQRQKLQQAAAAAQTPAQGKALNQAQADQANPTDGPGVNPGR